MKHLYLLRHAKSSWDEPRLADRDRPLNRRGRRAVAQMAAAGILERDASCRICTSPARRARDTIEGIVELSPGMYRVEVVESLYTFSVRDLMAWLMQQDDAQPALMIVAHNPALEVLLALLTGTEVRKFPTCAFAALHIDIEHWADLAPRSARLVEYLRPGKEAAFCPEDR